MTTTTHTTHAQARLNTAAACANCGRRGPLSTTNLCESCDRAQTAARRQGVVR